MRIGVGGVGELLPGGDEGVAVLENGFKGGGQYCGAAV